MKREYSGLVQFEHDNLWIGEFSAYEVFEEFAGQTVYLTLDDTSETVESRDEYEQFMQERKAKATRDNIYRILRKLGYPGAVRDLQIYLGDVEPQDDKAAPI